MPGKCWESCYISALNKHSPFTFLFAVPLLQWKAAQASMLYTVTGLPMLLCCFRDGDDICPPGTSGELNSLFLQAQTTRQGSSLFRDHLESWALSLSIKGTFHPTYSAVLFIFFFFFFIFLYHRLPSPVIPQEVILCNSLGSLVLF